MDVEHLIADAAMILLYWQQNKILALQGPQMTASEASLNRRWRRYWPMVLMTVLVLAIFAQPFAQPYLVRRAALWSGAPAIHVEPVVSQSPVHSFGEQNRQISNLKTQLRDADAKIAQLQARLDADAKERDAARAETTQRALAFCHSGLLNQFQLLAGLQRVAREQFNALHGQTCATASCQKNVDEVADGLVSLTNTRDATRRKMLDLLGLPSSEPGCAPVPGE
jgi:outer membrane murein-binding lipoprotein Lpp